LAKTGKGLSHRRPGPASEKIRIDSAGDVIGATSRKPSVLGYSFAAALKKKDDDASQRSMLWNACDPRLVAENQKLMAATVRCFLQRLDQRRQHVAVKAAGGWEPEKEKAKRSNEHKAIGRNVYEDAF
jgi:hypothetical protein